MTTSTTPTRKNRLRRLAARQGLALMKSRGCNPEVYTYGTYMLVESNHNIMVAVEGQNGYGQDLDAIEAWLTS